ncbi:MAG TPA: hypothetical protein VIL72_03620 [Beijerinckiaceae bacterium]|jgi:uncharacterized membrane protein
MKRLDGLLGLLPYILGAAMTAAATHLLATLALPHLAPQDAFARLARVAAPNRFVVLEPQTPGAELLPFEDPATVVGVCRFDLRAGPVRVRAEFAPDDGLVTFSFRDRRGATFYALTDRGGLRNRLDVVLLTRQQLETLETFDPEDELPQELRLTPPDMDGFVVARSFIQDRLDAPAARRRLAAASCAQEAVGR